MTQEEKELLFNDLCERLPYGINVLVYVVDLDIKGIGKLNSVSTYNFLVDIEDFEPFKEYKGRLINFGGKYPLTIGEIKPFLRPMSSMTDEEKEHLQALHDIISDENYGDGYSPAAWDVISEFNDYCHVHHLDNRGLICKGLALEAPAQMYD